MKTWITMMGWVLALAAAGASAETMKIPLQQLTPLKAIELRCITDEREVSLPIPDRWDVKRLVLHLRYTVSSNLLPDVSQLVVKVRGQPVAQARLNPLAPDVRIGIEIPPRLFEPGYNALAFNVAQHWSRQQCEAPCAPDLWTNIDLRDSYVEIDYAMKPVPRELSALSTHVFDPRLMPAGAVHVVTEDASAASATLAGIVASGIARRFDYRRVEFSVSRELRPGFDNVVVGKRAFVNRLLGQRGVALAASQGGYLKLLPMAADGGGEDPTRALLVISGEDESAARLAAITFSNISFRFPGSDELKAFAFQLPEVQQYSGRETIATDTVYQFKTLNFPTQSFVGINPGQRTITFRLPPDFHIRPNQYAKLSLSFSYGAGLKNDSSLNIAVNGRGMRAVLLDSPTGSFIDGYKIDIPTYAFQPGTNTIALSGHLHTGGQLCDLIFADNLFLTVYDVSTLTFPAMPHLVEMPKLELFVHSGFPLTRWPDGHEAFVYLTEKDDHTLGAALNLVGLATQRNGFPLFGLTFTYDPPKGEGEVLVIGRPQSVPKELRAAAPIKMLEDGVTVPYPVVRGWNNEAVAAVSRQQSALGPGRGLLMQFQSPSHAGRSVVMLTATRTEDLFTASQALLTSTAQAASKGDLVLIEPGEPDARVTSMETGLRYVTGRKGSFSRVESFFYTRPIVYYTVIAVVLLLLAGGLFVAMRRWRAKRKGV